MQRIVYALRQIFIDAGHSGKFFNTGTSDSLQAAKIMNQLLASTGAHPFDLFKL